MTATIVVCPHCGTKNRVRPRSDGVPRCANCHHHLPWLVNATTPSFDAEIEASVPVLIDFWAEWCGPCKMIAPILENAAREHAGKLKVVKVDIDSEPVLAQRYGVQGIPLLLLLRNGDEIARLPGAAPQRQFEAWLAPHLETAETSA